MIIFAIVKPDIKKEYSFEEMTNIADVIYEQTGESVMRLDMTNKIVEVKDTTTGEVVWTFD